VPIAVPRGVETMTNALRAASTEGRFTVVVADWNREYVPAAVTMASPAATALAMGLVHGRLLDEAERQPYQRTS